MKAAVEACYGSRSIRGMYHKTSQAVFAAKEGNIERERQKGSYLLWHSRGVFGVKDSSPPSAHYSYLRR